MLKNYIIIAIRHLLVHRFFSLVNILGLAIGMACCILILLYVQNELSYDTYHHNADRIVRLAGRSQIRHNAQVPLMMCDMFPEIEDVVRFDRRTVLVTYKDQVFYERFYFADPSVFDIFSFVLVKGNIKTALSEPYSIIITEEMAEKYFSDKNPMGKMLSIDPGNAKTYKITGILQDLPPKSHFQFDFLASFSTLSQAYPGSLNPNGNRFYAYFLLTPTGFLEGKGKRTPYVIERAFQGQIEAFHIQPLKSIHLHSHLRDELEANGNITYVYIFSATAALILLMACLNFMNLSTARSTARAREVGMRKVVGALRRQLIQQFFGESILTAFVATIIAVVIAEISLPSVNAFLNQNLSIQYTNNILSLTMLLSLALLVGILSGSYPAFFLSAFHPVESLKGAYRRSSFIHRRILMSTQFTISIILIIGSFISYHQLVFLKNKDLGFDRDQIVSIQILKGNLQRNYESLKNEFLKHPAIRTATASNFLPNRSGGGYGGQTYPDGHYWQLWEFAIDDQFIPNFNIELVAGRNFSKAFKNDIDDAIILNESAVKQIGWKSPREAIGQRTYLGLAGSKMADGQTVIGVVKDFHYRSLRQPLNPMLFYTASNMGSYLSLKLKSDKISEAMNFIESKWHEYLPNHPFQYRFMDDHLNSLYQREERQTYLFGVFTILAILVSCLGLLGLASFTSEQRTKEMGIRKVLGASIPNIVGLLLREFFLLSLAANILAWPVIYYASSKWLENFAYRIHIGLEPFILGGILTVLITVITAGYQAVKVAVANPVKALRYE